MTFLTLWLVVLILERSIASKHRSVNLALETVLQFDRADDFNVINKVQDFLSHIQVLLKRQHPVNDNITTARRNNKYKFTDFVEDLITTVKTFEDNNLKEVFRIVYKNFRTRNIDDDLIDDNVRRFLSRKLTEIRNQPANKIRRDLDTILRELQDDRNIKNSFLLDFINSLYKNDSEKKLSKLIKRLNLFGKSARKSKVALKSIIDKVVNDVIYEHYSNLENNEKRYIKNFVKSYLKDDITTTNLNIKQRAKVINNNQESINTDEKTDKSKPTEQITTIELTPETFKDISEETTKKIFTHITLYPKTIKDKKLLKFRTGNPTVHVIKNKSKNKEITKDKRDEEVTKKANEIFTNQSVEINVNLMLKHSQDLQDRKDSRMVESFRAKSPPIKGFLETFERALKNSRKKKKSFKSSTHDISRETFGSLYQIMTPKKYNNNKISRLGTYNGKTTVKDRFYKSTYVDDIVKETNFREKLHVVGDHRRVNKLTNLNEDIVTESDLKNVVTSTTTQQSTLTARVIKPLIISTAEVRTSVVTTDKSTKTTESDVLNEIFDKKNKTELKKATKNKTLFEGISTNIGFTPKDNITIFVSKSHINNKTTVSEASSVAFDVNNYIKHSEIIKSLKNDDRKKLIEDKMKADLGALLDPPATNTTEGFTDIFKELEDAFQV